MKDGSLLESYVEHALGSLGNPLKDADLDAKLRGQAAGILPLAVTERLIRACWAIEDLDDVAGIGALTCAGAVADRPYAAPV